MGLRDAVLRACDQVVGQYELGSRHGVERQAYFTRISEETDCSLDGPEQTAAEPFASFDRRRKLDLGLQADKSIIVFAANQRTIDSR